MKTLKEILESTSQEIVRQQAQFQLFFEESKEQIIQAVTTTARSLCLRQH